MRFGWLSVAATTFAAAVAVAGGCSSFTAADDVDAGDGGGDVPDAGPATCTPSGTVSRPVTCTKCSPDVHFGSMGFDVAIVVGNTAYAVSAGDNEIYTASTQGNDVFKSSEQVIRGVPQNLAADDQWLYVSTDERVVRAKLDNVKTQEQLVDTSMARVSPYRSVLGRTFLYRLVPRPDGSTTVLTRPKVQGGDELSAVVSLSAFDADGDDAYYAPRRAPGNNPPPTYLTKLLGSSTHGPALPADAIGLAIRHPYAYVAYPLGSNTLIARLPIDDRADAQVVPLVLEPGVIDTFAIDGDRLYWSASRGSGKDAVATADLCGGDARDIALDVTPFGQLSFDADYVYGGGNPSGPTGGGAQPLVRFPKK